MTGTPKRSPLDEALAQFDLVEANLAKLEQLWNDISRLVPGGISFGSDGRYEDRCREFRSVLEHMPKIDGWELKDKTWDINDIGQARFDAAEVAEPIATIRIEESIYGMGDDLAEYRFRLESKRRQLVRDAILGHIDDIDAALRSLEPLGSGADT